MAKARMFGRISKVEVLDDGTRMVTGVASTPTKDNDGETFTGDCLRGAIPDYLAKRRAVREMHQPIAAGVTKEMWVDDDDVTHIVAHVVDPVSVLKLDTGVLKMFSIEGVVPPGGRDSSNSKQINKLFLREVSLVDVGANPDAMIEVVKLDGAGEESEAQVAEEVTTAPVETEATHDTATKVAVAIVGDTVRKGLYGVSRFADLLASLGYQVSDAQNESDWEGDSSPLPAKMREWLASGAEILKAMTEEETSELLASLAPPVPTVVARAAHANEDADNIEKGDFPGHPFHGNQHVGGGGTDKGHGASRAAHESSKSTHEKSTKAGHLKAAAAHHKANVANTKAGRSGTAAYHASMAKYHESRASRFAKAASSDATEAATGADHDELAKCMGSLMDEHDNKADMVAKCAGALAPHYGEVAKDDEDTAKADVGTGEDVIAKVAGLEDSISKVSAERDTLKGEVAKLQGEAVQHQASLDEIVKNMKAKGFLVEADKSKDMVSKSEKAVEAESTEPLDVMKKLFASGPTIKPRA